MVALGRPLCDDPDLIARNLATLANVGRRMPPSWDGARVSIPVAGQGGAYMGRVLPGRGLYLPFDAKDLGLRRLPSHVYTRTPVARAMELFDGAERMAIGAVSSEQEAKALRALRLAVGGAAITTYDGIIAARAGGKADDVAITKASLTTVASIWSSLFSQVGGNPVAGTYTAISGGAAHNKSSTGAWSYGLTNPTAPDKKYLLTVGITSGTALNILMLVDLLVGAGSINANLNTSQTVNTTALTRYTAGAGVQLIFEVTTALGATPANITVTYTNQSSTGSRSTGAQTMTPSAIVGRLQPITQPPTTPLASGDYGVKSVESVILSAAMAAGVVALNLYFPIAFLPGVAASVYVERDSTNQIDGLTELVTEAGGSLGCLIGYVLANTTSTGTFTAFMRTCAG